MRRWAICSNARTPNGFNLMLYDGERFGIYEAAWQIRPNLAPGVYGLSNHPRHFLAEGRQGEVPTVQGLHHLPDEHALIQLLRDDSPAAR